MFPALSEFLQKSSDTALHLAHYFGTYEAFWMGLQADYELEEARERLGDRLDCEVRSRAARHQLPCRLQRAAVNIFSMSHLYYHYNKFNIIDSVNNAVNALAYTIPVVAG